MMYWVQIPLWILLCGLLVAKNRAAGFVSVQQPTTSKWIRTKTRTTGSTCFVHVDKSSECNLDRPISVPRRFFLSTIASSALVVVSLDATPTSLSSAAQAFDGGVGGLGKTRPETGVVRVDPDAPLEQTAAGVVSTEIYVGSSQSDVALVSFQSPWPLLGTSGGLETRDLATSDAAFVSVVPGSLTKAASPKEAASMLKQILLESVLAPQGKFGMYGAPTSVKVKAIADDASLYQLTFTTLTPGMRESDRKYLVKVRHVSNTLVLLLVGTTANRFGGQEGVMQKVAQSFQVVQAPKRAARG